MRRPLLFLIFLLVLDAAVVWRPFDTEAIAWQSGWSSKKTAGQMVDGFHLSQEVPSALLAQPVPRKRITHWWRSHRKLHAHAPNCFAIRFTTYNRPNEGRIAVSYRQGDVSQEWGIESGTLHKGYRRFCPSAGLRNDQPLHITLTGIGGERGKSPTAWLSHSDQLKPATVNGQRLKKRSLHLRLAYFHRVTPMETASLDKGAYAFACLASLLIALAAILALFGRTDRPKEVCDKDA